jgi:hypothetical protein
MSSLESTNSIQPEALEELTPLEDGPLSLGFSDFDNSQARGPFQTPASATNAVREKVKTVGPKSGRQSWTFGLKAAAILMGVMGVYGVLGGLWQMWGLTTLESSIEALSALAGKMPQLHATVETLQLQLENLPMMLIVCGFRIVVGVLFLIGAGLLKQRSEGANAIASMICGLAVLYNIAVLYVGWLCMPDLSALPGLNADAAAVATTVAVCIAVGILIAKLVIHGVIIGVMNSASAKTIFGPIERPRETAIVSGA